MSTLQQAQKRDTKIITLLYTINSTKIKYLLSLCMYTIANWPESRRNCIIVIVNIFQHGAKAITHGNVVTKPFREVNGQKTEYEIL